MFVTYSTTWLIQDSQVVIFFFFLVDFHLLLNCLTEAINDENWDKFRPNDKDYLWKHIYATDIM